MHRLIRFLPGSAFIFTSAVRLLAQSPRGDMPPATPDATPRRRLGSASFQGFSNVTSIIRAF